MENYEFLGTIATVILAAVAVGGLILRLEGRIARIESRMSHLEGLFQGYFLQADKPKDPPPSVISWCSSFAQQVVLGAPKLPDIAGRSQFAVLCAFFLVGIASPYHTPPCVRRATHSRRSFSPLLFLCRVSFAVSAKLLVPPLGLRAEGENLFFEAFFRRVAGVVYVQGGHASAHVQAPPLARNGFRHGGFRPAEFGCEIPRGFLPRRARRGALDAQTQCM